MNAQIQDGFSRYFSEKLWEMIPAIYRHEDGLAKNPGVLRALVEILGEQAAILRRSHDRLWDDQFIELCDDWAVPYLADLVGTRLVSALNARGRRIDVAKTIYYRRRKGTLRVLEELIGDISGWDGAVVENFRRLVRTRHRLDPPPSPSAGRHTRTLPGGWADLRSPRSFELVGGPFDEFHYTPDLRQHRGARGRYGIPKVAFHLFRRRSFGVAGVDPRNTFAETGFTFDPSGRDIPLFIAGDHYSETWQWDEWASLREWEVPGPIRRRVLGHVEFQITEEALVDLQVHELRRLKGWRYSGDHDFILALCSYSSIDETYYRDVMAACLVSDCGKRALVPHSTSINLPQGDELGPNDVVAGNLETWGRVPPSGTRAVIDPECGRFNLSKVPSAGMTVFYHYGWSADIGACPIDRRQAERDIPDRAWIDGTPADFPQSGILEIKDNRTYRLPGDNSVRLTGNLTLRAANQRRPYVVITRSLEFALESTAAPDANLKLTFDGVWFGGSGELRITGNFESVLIRHVTLDPGHRDKEGNVVIPAIKLVVTGHVEILEIDRSILSSIDMESSGHVERAVITNSIIDAQCIDNVNDTNNKEMYAILAPRTDLEAKAVTIFGDVKARRLNASELIAAGTLTLADTQNGCFRFSSAPEGSRLPRPYEHFELPSSGWQHFFTSRSFGNPNYARLSENAPSELRAGGEDGLEMGAFNDDREPIRLQSLQTKVGEYLPFGLVPLFINET